MINIFDIFGNIVDFFYGIGYFGEYITFIFTIFLLYSQSFNLIFYIVLFILNRLINNYLKDYFKGSRPTEPKKFLDDDTFSKKKYGMPSGHSQLSFFSLAYSYFSINKITTSIILMLITCLIVIYERYVYKNHTLFQLISGAIIGILIAYLSHKIYLSLNKYI
jgi:membrane-associated phospholipid phosphatase